MCVCIYIHMCIYIYMLVSSLNARLRENMSTEASESTVNRRHFHSRPQTELMNRWNS